MKRFPHRGDKDDELGRRAVAPLNISAPLLFQQMSSPRRPDPTWMPRLDFIRWNWSTSFLWRGRMSCGTNFSCTAKPYSRMCACRQEGGGGDAGQSGNTDVFKCHADAVGMEVLRVGKLSTLGQKTFCCFFLKITSCALISELMIILCSLPVFLPYFSSKVALKCSL